MANFLSKVRIDGVDANIKDASLTEALNTEITNRTAEDARINAALAAETAARAAADQELEDALEGAIESVVSVDSEDNPFINLKLYRYADSNIYHFSFKPSAVHVVAPNGTPAAPRPNTVTLVEWAAANIPDFVINGGFRQATYYNGTYWYDPDDTTSYATVFLALEPDNIEWCALEDGIETLHRQGYDNIVASIDPVITNGQAFDHSIYNDAEHQAFYTATATRLAITVDNGFWEVFIIEGRTAYNKGMTFAEQAQFFLSKGYSNVFSLDGGGSTGAAFGSLPAVPIQDWTDTPYGRDNLVNFIQFFR